MKDKSKNKYIIRQMHAQKHNDSVPDLHQDSFIIHEASNPVPTVTEADGQKHAGGAALCHGTV